MSQPLISIIIPTYRRPDFLKRCLDAIAGQLDLPGPENLEIFVSYDDPGAGDGNVPSPLENIAVVHGLNAGAGAARNRAAALAQGEWLLFVDDDCVPQPGWIAAMLSAIRDAGSASVLEGKTICPQSLDLIKWEAPVNLDGGHLPSCNFAIRKDLYDQLGGFDERYRVAFEDMEFRARLIAIGAGLRFVEDAVVSHDRREIPKAAGLAARWESRVLFALDTGAEPFQILWRLPRHVFMVILSRYRECRFDFRNFLLIPRFKLEWALVVWRLPGWLKKYRREPRKLFWLDPGHLATIPPNHGL